MLSPSGVNAPGLPNNLFWRVGSVAVGLLSRGESKWLFFSKVPYVIKNKIKFWL
jgi:hypothetical protein